MMSERTVELVHSVYDRGTWATVVSCDLQGLFDADDARGCDIGRTLGGPADAGVQRRGRGRMYWLTRESGHILMSLYGHIADRSRFINHRKLVA